MIMMNLLQTAAAQADTVKNVHKEIAEVAEIIAKTPADQLLSGLLDKIVSFGLKVLFAVVIYMVGAWLIKKFKVMLSAIFLKRNTEPSIVTFVQSMTSIALTIMLIIITVGILGIDTTSIAALLAGGGMAIGMALNGTVQNFAGGIMILVFRPFKAGDFIEAQGFTGTVKEVTIVSTKLVTVDNRNIIIPNGALSNGTVNNYSQNQFRRVDWLVDVEYGTECEAAKEILMSLMKNDKRILTVEEGVPANPFVSLNALRDSSIQFIMRAWVKSPDYWDVFFSMNETIYNTLPSKGIQFPFPQLDVNIKNN